MSVVEIYTDGACVPNPGPGGWGAVLRWGTTEKDLCTVAMPRRPRTTGWSSIAPIRALESLTRARSTVLIYTDSIYVRDGITKWLPRWSANGWLTAARHWSKTRTWAAAGRGGAPARRAVALGQGPRRTPGERTR